MATRDAAGLSPGLDDHCRGAGLRPGAVNAVVVLFNDGATGAGVFNGVGAGTGAGVDAIVRMFIDDAVRGADQSADASGVAANATAVCVEISSLPLRPPTLHSISASAPSLA